MSNDSTDSDSDTTLSDTVVPVIDTPTHLSVASQAQSPLMQLPAEIRLLILRELLLSSKPIAERQTYTKQGLRLPSGVPTRDAKGQFLKKSAIMASGHRLTPAILVACQLLLSEGWPVLYEENTLAIQIFSGYRPRNPGDRPSFHYYRVSIDALGGIGTFERGIPWTRSVSPARALISRFKNLHISLNARYATSVKEILGYEHFANAVGTIAPLLTASCVELAVIGQSSRLSSSQLRRQLKVFQILRCKHFKINATSLVKCVLDDIDNAKTVQTIESTVTSNRPVVLLYEVVKKLWRTVQLLDWFYMTVEARPRRDWLSDFWNEIDNVVMDYDSEKFFQLRGELFSRLRDGVTRLEHEACNEG